MRKDIVFGHNQRSELNVFHLTTVREVENKITKITFWIIKLTRGSCSMFQSTGICEQLQFRQIRRLFTFYRQKFLYSIIGLSNFTPFRCLLKGVKLGILLLSNGRACLGFNSIKASAIVCRLRSGVPKWQFLKYLWLCGMEILGYKTACCHKLRRWLFGPFWESDDCLLYYPSLKENFGCHVTRSK